MGLNCITLFYTMCKIALKKEAHKGSFLIFKTSRSQKVKLKLPNNF